MMRSVAAIGNVEDINTWSNIPYFFYSEGKKLGLFNEAWKLDLTPFNWQRKIWNLRQLVQLKGRGGFQYSDSFLVNAEKQMPKELFSTDIITFNQHFPRYNSVKAAGGNLYHYIDAPFLSLIESSHYGFSLPKQKAKKALQLEKENYQGSKAIVTMANWVAEVLIDEYKLPPDKVYTIMPGANIHVPEGFTFTPFVPEAGLHRDFKLGFIGKDWKRKGLDIAYDAANVLSERGYKIALEIIGYAPEYMTNDPKVNYHGFINKHTDQQKFVDIVSSCDLGCVFSLDEAFGISTLEFLRLGVPITGFLDKGLQDTIPEDAGIGFQPGTLSPEIADALEALIKDEPRQMYLRKNAKKWANHVTWERCIKEWKEKIFNE